MTRDTPDGSQTPIRAARWSGVMAIAAALALQYALHAARSDLIFIPYAAGNRAIRHMPGWLTSEVIARLQAEAKPLLALTIVLALLAAGYVLGSVARTRLPIILGALVAVATLLVAYADPLPASILPVLISALASGAVAVLVAWGSMALLARIPDRDTSSRPVDVRRRRMLGAGVTLAGVGVVGGIAMAWWWLRDTSSAVLSAATQITGRSPHDTDFSEVEGLPSTVTPNDDHYIIRLTFSDPDLDPVDWRLPIHGEVGADVTLSLADLESMPAVEHPVVMACISNPVGGRYVGNAYWTGVQLRDVLASVDVLPTAVQVLATSHDGYSETLDLDVIDSEDVLVVFAMNGEPLPVEHGAPARLIHIGRFGMRSVKWLDQLELIPSPQLGYWEQRGWDQQAIMRTSSRINAPASRSVVASPFIIAGTAWAGTRGIGAVEVSIDDGVTWLPTQLEQPLGDFAWRRWQQALDLDPGEYTVRARAIEVDGTVQDEERRPALPSGATGYHSVAVTVVPAGRM